jgi:hypothetical protein
MAQDNVGQTATAQDNQEDVIEVLRKSALDRAALDALLGPLFQGLWTDFLDILFELLPHDKGDKSANERLYQLYRHRVLNLGNRKRRDVPNITRDFIVWQVFKREIITQQKIQGHGPWNLPPGVKMPSERTVANVDDRR